MKNKWIKTTDRFVAFFDIMGFKDMVQRNTHDRILDKLETLKSVLKQIEGWNSETNIRLKDFKIEEFQTRSITFSDSIIIFSKGDTINDFDKILIDSYMILRNAIENGIGIKGALSYGRLTVDFDNYLFFGQPLIDAFLLHDELLIYTAILDNNIESKLRTLGKHHLDDNLIVNYKTPLKSGKINHKILNFQSKKRDETIMDLEKIYDSVAGRPRLYVDNTIEFFKANPIKE